MYTIQDSRWPEDKLKHAPWYQLITKVQHKQITDTTIYKKDAFTFPNHDHKGQSYPH